MNKPLIYTGNMDQRGYLPINKRVIWSRGGGPYKYNKVNTLYIKNTGLGVYRGINRPGGFIGHILTRKQSRPLDTKSNSPGWISFIFNTLYSLKNKLSTFVTCDQICTISNILKTKGIQK